ncbi:2,5-diketo-D-gluconate reductase A [Bifidobacterium sp. DSM 109963]|uniref:2,5-diketo-D-gluconate reductase A n=1 Tax=Bifidobacterium panos TaxID=2675321 RepID=A0ABX1SVQ3_9BIFI|nr:2,5-diketo-D-gluconate reductase A [Bifidobacterium sp. DSM 109963]
MPIRRAGTLAILLAIWGIWLGLAMRCAACGVRYAWCGIRHHFWGFLRVIGQNVCLRGVIRWRLGIVCWCGIRSSRCRCRTGWGCRTSRTRPAGRVPRPACSCSICRSVSALAASQPAGSGRSPCWWHHQQIALIRRSRLRPRWWRSMSRMRAFHDSMRLFVRRYRCLASGAQGNSHTP